MEKRRYERFETNGIEISPNPLFSSEMSILDVSLDGISVNAEKGMKTGKEYLLKIKANDMIVPLKATVVWCMLRESRKMFNGDVAPVYTIGFHLNNSSSEMQTIIEALRRVKFTSSSSLRDSYSSTFV